MNMSRQQLPRGNKLLLPKIEYAGLVESQPFNGETPNTGNINSRREKNNGEFEVPEKIPLLNNDYKPGSFTRFSVLPPINDSVRNTSRLSRLRRISGAFVSTNGPSPTSNHELSNKQRDDNKSYKYLGFSSGAVQQRRASTIDKEYVQSLQVVGKPYSRDKNNTSLSTHGRLNAKSPRRSFSSPMPSDASDSNCRACKTLLARRRSKTEGAKFSGNRESVQTDKLAHTCNKNEAYTKHILKRFNSEDLDLRNDNIVSGHIERAPSSRSRKKSPKLISKPEITINLKTANLATSDGRRPVSRCEISLDVKEATQPEKLQVVTDRGKEQVKSQERNFKPPLIQVDNIETEVTQNEETPSTQGMPQIQILIDSLESAKEERPKAGREVPYTSVREQRRRSALCRTNSKQVDDFLLVHNLRDLGLL